MTRLKLATILFVAVVLAGCGLSPAALSALQGLAETAEARSENFATVSPALKAKDDKDADAVAEWKLYHQAGLASQAAALRNLLKAVRE